MIFQGEDRYLAETTPANPPERTDPGQVMSWKGYLPSYWYEDRDQQIRESRVRKSQLHVFVFDPET